MFREPYLGIFCIGAILASNTITILPSFYVKGKAGKFLNAWGWAFLLFGNVFALAVLPLPGVLATNFSPSCLWSVFAIVLFVPRCAFELGKIATALAKNEAGSGCPKGPGEI